MNNITLPEFLYFHTLLCEMCNKYNCPKDLVCKIYFYLSIKDIGRKIFKRLDVSLNRFMSIRKKLLNSDSDSDIDCLINGSDDLIFFLMYEDRETSEILMKFFKPSRNFEAAEFQREIEKSFYVDKDMDATISHIDKYISFLIQRREEDSKNERNYKFHFNNLYFYRDRCTPKELAVSLQFIVSYSYVPFFDTLPLYGRSEMLLEYFGFDINDSPIRYKMKEAFLKSYVDHETALEFIYFREDCTYDPRLPKWIKNSDKSEKTCN